MSKHELPETSPSLGHLFKKATQHIENAREDVRRSVNSEMVKAYWLIGRDLVEEEQQGKARADYGTYLIGWLSEQLTKKYGKGFSISTLKDIRLFYLTYSGDGFQP